MAIRFYCKQCGQLLGIASRKAGTLIDCPKCACPQVVPSEEAAAAAIAVPGQERDPVDAIPKPAGYDDEASLMETSGRIATHATAPTPPSVSVPAPPAGYEAARPMPSGTILYRRRTLYLHGLLFLLLAGGAFAAGYFIGRGDATAVRQIARKQDAKQPVLVEGKLYYHTGTGRIAPDQGAVVIVLPAETLPETTLPIQGLRPIDPLSEPAGESLRKIEAFGGVYCRADDSGTFRTVLPEEGRYRLLLISRQTKRAPGTDIDALDLAEISRYFYRPADLVGPHKYRWTLEEITSRSHPIEHNFGRTAEE